MNKSSKRIEAYRQIKKIGLQAIQAGFSSAGPGISTMALETVIRDALAAVPGVLIESVQVAAGKRLDIKEIQTATIRDGDWVWIQVVIEKEDIPIRLSRLGVIGTPSPAQKDFLTHLQEAVDWMVEGLQPNKKMGFYFTESRGRNIIPHGRLLNSDDAGEKTIEPGKRFMIEPGNILSIEPALQSNAFGAASINALVLMGEDRAIVI